MNIFLAIIVYLIMAAVLVAGVLMAVKGTFWLLILGLLCFVLGVTKISILPHH
jgi:1,4-dihydroxy-2-naphthoate octaprenyltransferase